MVGNPQADSVRNRRKEFPKDPLRLLPKGLFREMGLFISLQSMHKITVLSNAID